MGGNEAQRIVKSNLNVKVNLIGQLSAKYTKKGTKRTVNVK